MTRIAELADRLQRLAKRREDEGIYTDAALCDEVATYLRAAGEEAGGVKVRALEWKRYRDGDADAVTPFGDVYTAYAGGYWRITERGKAGKFIRAGFDTASAKAAAQADYERRVLSALEPAPSPIVDDAMVERAARNALMYLKTGFIECDHCGHEIKTNTLDAVYELNAALSGAREEGE
ncbi:hypothetical protein NA8A_18322 [Nitratireductor indicus C115]|uniref:Uncharacterized protein n=1 Tax=Nitratireductor indicus C115 TaxID=1231190 RepID=K2NSU7_9HYPH|nr:hypothetical protein [Nitratireductor indicus]EKF40874.1 hypothetical protein NA8A_18322 [Nitratireductor indicus C115]SFQ33332.1 hypothetical protein SAMN05216176_102628 [Nitratireductor indicus]